MHVNLQNDIGQIKSCKVGFSWTTFFFGLFVPLIRGDWKWALIMFVASLVTFGVSNFIFCFVYNKIYINSLLEKGFKPSGEADRSILVSKNILCNKSSVTE